VGRQGLEADRAPPFAASLDTSFGPGAEIATSIMEGAFLSLEALIKRVAGCDLSFVGFAREKMNVPDLARVVAAARQTLAY
jgi:2-oxoisovalerate dehydrogenase E1 component subunit beta